MPLPIEKTTDKPVDRVEIVTTGYVYDTPGKPPHKIGTTLFVSASEAQRLGQLRLARLASDVPEDVENVGAKPDLAVKLSPPPPAPPAVPEPPK